MWKFLNVPVAISGMPLQKQHAVDHRVHNCNKKSGENVNYFAEY